jgi:hypothetical protein
MCWQHRAEGPPAAPQCTTTSGSPAACSAGAVPLPAAAAPAAAASSMPRGTPQSHTHLHPSSWSLSGAKMGSCSSDTAGCWAAAAISCTLPAVLLCSGTPWGVALLQFMGIAHHSCLTQLPLAKRRRSLPSSSIEWSCRASPGSCSHGTWPVKPVKT